MKTFTTAFLLMILVCFSPAAHACTGIYASDGKTVLAGNNEDFWNLDTKMWIVPPEEGKYGRIYFGFKDKNPQGGMNEKGLFFDGFATERCEVKESLGKPMYRGHMADDAMAQCATVEEVIELFSGYNLQILENAMLMFGDATGDSVIIEGDRFLRKKGRYQVVTNFYQSMTDPDRIPCQRFKIATKLFEEDPVVSVDLFRRVLAGVHSEIMSPTVYSNIYDLKNKVVYLYHFHNFENAVKIDLAEELKKGAHTVDLPSLFPPTFAEMHFKWWKEDDVEKKRAKRRDDTVDPKIFADYAGSYVALDGVYAGTAINVVLEEGKLHMEVTGQESFDLIPEGKDRFFQIGIYGSQDLTFLRNEKGKVTHLTYEFFMRKIKAKKIRSNTSGE
jgi:hypothetical protein